MDLTYNILDFETTGFSTDLDRVIEVGVVKIKNHNVVDTFQELINPEIFISSVITNLTGITNQMVRGAETSSTVMPRLKNFVGDEVIVAHNASFDSRFYKAEMKRARIQTSNQFLCSLLLARRIFQELDSHRLGSLCHHLGYINKASHRALGDAEATHKVFSAICERIKTSTGLSQIDNNYLAKLSKIPKSKVQALLNNQKYS